MDLTPLVVEAFGHNRKIHSDIDRLYQTKKHEFYRRARGSKYYNHTIIREGDITREEYAKKALGILLYLVDTNDEHLHDAMTKIIQKGWTRAFSYVTHHDEVSMEEYMANYIKPDYFKTDDDLNTELLMVYWLAIITGKKLVPDEALERIESFFLQRLDFTKKDSRIKFSHRAFDSTLLKNIRVLNRRIHERYGVVPNDIFVNEDVFELMEPISLIADTENMSLPSLFNNVKISDRDVEEILGAYYVKHQNKNAEEAVKHLVWGLVLKGILKAYKQVKQHYFENNKETLYLEMENQEHRIEKLSGENTVLKEKVKKLSQEARSAREEAEKAHRNRIRELEAEVSRLEKELAAEKEKNYELAALREFLFSLDRGLVPETTGETPDLTGVSGAIIGGHERWHKKMKELLPNFVFISTENFDARLLDNVDVVLFFTQYLGHALYYRAVNEARKRRVKIGYINSLNEGLVLREISIIARSVK